MAKQPVLPTAASTRKKRPNCNYGSWTTVNQSTATNTHSRARRSGANSNSNPLQDSPTMTAGSTKDKQGPKVSVLKSTYDQLKADAKDWERKYKECLAELRRSQGAHKDTTEEFDKFKTRTCKTLEDLRLTNSRLEGMVGRAGNVAKAHQKEDMVQVVTDVVQKYLFRNVKFVTDEADLTEKTKMCIKYIQYEGHTLDYDEEQWITTYKDVVSSQLSECRGYVQSEGKKRAKGKMDLLCLCPLFTVFLHRISASHTWFFSFTQNGLTIMTENFQLSRKC